MYAGERRRFEKVRESLRKLENKVEESSSKFENIGEQIEKVGGSSRQLDRVR